jgi:YVTN family beta-propeller protein
VLSPDGRYLLVSNGGAGVQSIQVVRTLNNQVIQTIPYYVPDSVFVGLAYSPDGKHAYASGGGADVVHTYDVNTSTGKLSPAGNITIGTLTANPYPMGLSISSDGKTLYVANNLANTVSIVDIATKSVTASIAVGSYPYTTLVSGDGKMVYVSNWGDATLSEIQLSSKKVIATIPVGNHPSAMAFGPRGILYITDGNSDAVSVVNRATKKEVRRISLALYRKAPLGSTPVGLAVSHNQKYLYVSNAGENAVAVIAIHNDDAPEQVIGRIPTAWYPTSVVVSKDDNSLFITNAKGRGAGPNNKLSKGSLPPNPERKNPPIVDGITGYNDGYCNCTFNDYSGSMIIGTLSSVIVPGQGLLDFYSSQVAINDHVGDTSVLQRSAGNPIPVPGGTSPIKHVIYIVKENRTYDQVFGDEYLGNNDPSLTLFPRANTPNLHSLTEQFGIFDNFYADAEVSADGHNWINSANASDYNEKMWPQDYSSGAGRNRGYDFEGGSSINLSPGGYLWDISKEAGITYRDYGEFYAFSSAKPKPIPAGQPCAGPIATSYTGVTIPAGDVLCFPASSVNAQVTPNLVGHFDPRFRTFDLNYRESDRVAEWNREYQQFVANNNMPQLEILRLPNDHTSGTTPGRLTPQAAVAENDNGVGQVADIVSHSKYWKDTAIFVTEDDAQNGPDHVDAHRTEALVISPYTRHSSVSVDHTQYDTAAMVRTMELILGLRAMSPYDVTATPMWRDFQAKPNLAPYNVLPENYPPTQVNPTNAPGAQASAAMDFNVADAIPEDQLNHILWTDIKGDDTPYPHIVGGTDVGSSGDTDG